MIKAVNSLLKKLQRAKVYVDVTVDHVELAEDYLMLGLDLNWHNQTSNPINVKEVEVRLFHRGKLDDPIRFRPQGHFARIPGQKVIKKVVGAKSFVVPAGKSHLEGIRFFTRSILDLDNGTYPVEIRTTVPEGTFVHQADVQITSRLKYRTAEPWVEAEDVT